MNGQLRDRDLVDVIAVLCLDALVLWGWRSTYAGSAWWIVALVTALLAVSVVVVVRDMAGNVLVVIGVLIVGFAVAAGPLAAGTLAVRGGDIFSSGLADIGRSWGRLLDTHPPVDPTGVLLLPPLAVSLLVAGLGSSVALWTTRPAAPLVPVGLGLAAVLVLGRHETTSAVVMGAGLAVVSLLWVRLRAGRRDEVRFGVDPVRTRGLGVTLVLLLVGSAMALGAVGDPGTDRFVLRDQVAGYDAAGERTPLDDFRDFTPQQGGASGNVAGQRLLVTDGLPPGTRLRFAALDDYDGTRWRAANDTDPLRYDDKFLRVGSSIDNPAAGEGVSAEITATKHWDRPWVPTVGAVQAFDVVGDEQRSELRYNPATQTAFLPGGLGAGVTYSFRSRTTDRRATDALQSSDAALDRDLQGRLEVLDAVVIGWNRGAPSTMSHLFDLLRQLRRTGRFSHGAAPWEQEYGPGHSLRRLTQDFLLAQPTVGDQEQYASAAALLATRLGVPARVVVGAIIPRGGVVRGRDVTAWIEVRLADGSWRTIPTEVFMGREPPDRRGPPPAVREFPPQQPSDLPQDDAVDADEDRLEDAESETEPTADRGDRAPWLLLLLLVLAPLVAPGLKAWRRRRRLRAATVSARYAGAWEELVDRARDLGIPVGTGTTRPTQAVVLDRGGDLALRADERIFSADPLDADEAAEFWRLVHLELRELDGTRPWWRRMAATLSPRSLWRR